MDKEFSITMEKFKKARVRFGDILDRSSIFIKTTYFGKENALA